MKIVHLCTSDDKGGAAISAHRLHRNLLQKNVESRFYVRNKFSKDDKTQAIAIASQGLMFKLKRWIFANKGQYFRKLDSPHIAFATNFTSVDSKAISNIESGDILHINWINNYLSFSDLNQLADRYKALVWRPSDMNPMTGGCMLSNGCERFQNSCGHCPAIKSEGAYDQSWIEMKRKKWELRRMKKRKLIMVAQSEWMKNNIERSALFASTPVVKINNGIDEKHFSLGDRMDARKVLGIGADELVIIAVAQSLKNKLKGFDLLHRIIDQLKDRIKCSVISIGSGELKIPGVKEYHFDYIEQKHMPDYYRASNVFVTTSRMENFPNNVLEASACGIPSVGFDVGGVSEIIDNQKTGYTIQPYEVHEFTQRLYELLINEELAKTLGLSARRRIENNFTIAIQTNKYIDLYKELLAS